jgi:hypothetical protein
MKVRKKKLMYFFFFFSKLLKNFISKKIAQIFIFLIIKERKFNLHFLLFHIKKKYKVKHLLKKKKFFSFSSFILESQIKIPQY